MNDAAVMQRTQLAEFLWLETLRSRKRGLHRLGSERRRDDLTKKKKEARTSQTRTVVLSVAKELSEIKISDFTSLFDPRFFFDPRFLLYLPSKSPNKDETRTIRKPLL